MAVDLIELAAGDCGECSGGIVRSGAVDCAYIDLSGITINADKRITAMALTTPSKTVEYIPTDGEGSGSRYDSVGERTGNTHRNNQEAFWKFPCLNNDKVKAGELLKSACCLVLVHEYANGMNAVQGIDAVPGATPGTYKAVFSKTKARATVSAFSDTPENEDRLEALITSVSRNVLVPTVVASFDLDDFLAL